uniref:Uncharacterized protein n=1 Tax=Globodera rostochiensis TaxID=31243 RepID=A0A914ICK5_GLORO
MKKFDNIFFSIELNGGGKEWMKCAAAATTAAAAATTTLAHELQQRTASFVVVTRPYIHPICPFETGK